MIKRMNHVGISVSNIDRSVAFYRDLLAMEVFFAPQPFGGSIYETIMRLKGAKGRVAVMRKADMEIELFEYLTPVPQPRSADREAYEHGISHFSFEVTDIKSEYERLSAAGVRFHCPPQNFQVALATWARDPDGNVFELVEPIREAS